MNKLVFSFILFNLILFNVIFSTGLTETPYTPQVITVAGPTVTPVNFFNDGEASYYTAFLKKNSPAVELEYSSIYVGKEEFGSFNLIISKSDISEGVYFDTLLISNSKGIFQEVPIIIGKESKVLDYDVSIEFDQDPDISFISGETVLSPKLNLYKLNYNARAPNGVAIKFFVYTVDGDILYSSEEVVSVSRQASFEYISNLGANPPSEVLIVALVESNLDGIGHSSIGLDLYQVSISSDLLLSPPIELIDYSSPIYIGIFIFLISSVILISYLWYHRSIEQAKDWKSRLNYIEKTQFSDAAKGLRKLKDQKDILERAYSNHYISKNSFDSAIIEISRLSKQLKKRL